MFTTKKTRPSDREIFLTSLLNAAREQPESIKNETHSALGGYTLEGFIMDSLLRSEKEKQNRGEYDDTRKKPSNTQDKNFYEFDQLWDDDKELKENIVLIFSTDMLKQKSTGFYDQKLVDMHLEYINLKKQVLDKLSEAKLTLEDFYQALVSAQSSRNTFSYPEGEIFKKIDYVLNKLNRFDPNLMHLLVQGAGSIQSPGLT